MFCRATGRTVVLPPRAPIYLLKSDKPLDATFLQGHPLPSGGGGGAGAASTGAAASLPSAAPRVLRSVVDFFEEGVAAMKAAGVVDVIGFREFVEREGGATGGLVAEASERVAVLPRDRGGLGPGAKGGSGPGATTAQLLEWTRLAEGGAATQAEGDAARKVMNACGVTMACFFSSYFSPIRCMITRRCGRGCARRCVRRGPETARTRVAGQQSWTGPRGSL